MLGKATTKGLEWTNVNFKSSPYKILMQSQRKLKD